MKNLVILFIVVVTGIFVPVSAETLNYRIIQNESGMAIVPYSSPSNVKYNAPILKIQSTPARIPYYSSERTLPKAKNKSRQV